MRTTLTLLAAAVLFSGVTAAQTTGAPGVNNFLINNQGSGTTSACINAISVTEGAPTTLVVDSAPFAPVALATAGICIPGNLGLGAPNLTWDIDVFTTEFIVDGFAGTPFPLGLAQTSSAGIWGLAITVPEGLDAVIPLQTAILDASFPIGIGATQAHLMLTGPAESLCSVTVGGDLSPLSDDGSVNVPLPFSFTFYGVSYTSVFVNMNGNLTFGSGDSDFTPTDSEMLSDQPRIAPAWDDWAPQYVGQGTVRVGSPGNNSFLAVEWADVSHIGSSTCNGQDSNTFCVRLFQNGNIDMAYAAMLLCQLGSSPGSQLVVGISPGNGISSTPSEDLTTGLTIGGPARAIYEEFTLSNPFDLSHLSTVLFQRLLFASNPSGGYTQGVVPF